MNETDSSGKETKRIYKGYDGREYVKVKVLSYAQRVIFNGLFICRVGKKVKGGRMLEPVEGIFKPFFADDETVVDRNFWINK